MIKMKSREISHEIINAPVDTNVKFRTSIDPGSYIPMHWHRAVEIIYMQEGSLDVTVESESFTIQKGDCIVINGNVLHSTKCTSPNTAILLQIPLDFMEKYIPDLGQLIFLFDFRIKDQRQQTKQAMLKTILEQLQIINDVRPDGYLLRFNSLIFELLFQLYHNFAVKILQNNTSQEKKDMDRLEPVLDYISEHYREPISLNEIAEVACLQAGYFCRFFKKKMGITFLEYQNEYRLSFIYRDLITTRDPVHVILERHGFTNYKLFRRIFLDHFGNTPTQIRKQREIL